MSNEELQMFTYEEAYHHVETMYFPNYFGFGLLMYPLEYIKDGFYNYVDAKRYQLNDMQLIAYNDLLLPKICHEIIEKKLKK